MPNHRLKPLPKNPGEVADDQLQPYQQDKSPAETVFSRNRANDISQKGDTDKNFKVGLADIDYAVKYYFEKIIRPSIISNGTRIPVPVEYGNQELWKTVQADGYMRDRNGKLMAPLILFQRDSIEKNRGIGNKLDGNKPNLYQSFEKIYTKQNRYDHFSVVNSIEPVKQYVTTVIPDYVTVTYSCVIFTDFMEQINPIIEAINYASDSYWGDLNRFKFRTRIDSFSTLTQLNIGEDRAAKSNFNIVLNGYIIPDTINKDLVTKNKTFSKSQILFSLETTTDDLESASANLRSSDKNSTPSTVVFQNTISISNQTNITNNNYGTIATQEIIYLNTNVTKQADKINSDNVTFNLTNVLQPPQGSVLPPTGVGHFLFTVNSLPVAPSAVRSITQVGNITNVAFDTQSMGYSLDSQDVVSGTGKFIDLAVNIDGVIDTESGDNIMTEDGYFLGFD